MTYQVNTQMETHQMHSTQSVSDDSFAAQLRGFGVAGIVAILVVVFTGNIILPKMVSLPVGAVLVLIWARLSHTSWHEIGYGKPKSWITTTVTGICLGATLKLLMKAVIMPLLGADPVNHAYHFLEGNRAMLPAATWSMLAAGFGEETVFRAFMFERLRRLWGESPSSKLFVVLFTSVVFGFSHYYNQGWAGVEQALITGLVFGTIFAATQNIWMVMIAHAVFDLMALAIIYKGMESQIAHWIFK